MTQSNHWKDILTADQIDNFHKLTASLDPSFAAKERAFYESRTVAQCEMLAAESWLCNEGWRYQLARSYAAIKQNT